MFFGGYNALGRHGFTHLVVNHRVHQLACTPTPVKACGFTLRDIYAAGIREDQKTLCSTIRCPLRVCLAQEESVDSFRCFSDFPSVF